MDPARPILTLTPNPAVDVATTCERVEPNRKLRCTRPRVAPGGGGINVSRVVHRLGHPTCAVFTAGGPTGDRLVEAVRREAFPTDVVRVEAPTRESITVTETATGDLYRFVVPGNPLAPAEGAALLGRFEAHLPGCALAVGSGSLPEGIGSDFWARTARAAKDAGRPFVLDTSQDADPALAVGVAVLRLNHSEVASLAGRPLSWPDEMADWCRGLVGRGAARSVIVTHGADGALLADGRGLFLSRPPPVEEASAVGAGDSFIAGLTVALVRGEAPEAALRLAMVAASAALITAGTELARREDIDRLAAEAPPPEVLDPPR